MLWSLPESWYSLYIPLCLYFNQHGKMHKKAYNFFTFHYVSILINMEDLIIDCFAGFTFHYVSILIFGADVRKAAGKNFTFHYVSILMCVRMYNRRLIRSLYIPLCLYFNYFHRDSGCWWDYFTFHYVSILIYCYHSA